jgi:hypothetical protein
MCNLCNMCNLSRLLIRARVILSQKNTGLPKSTRAEVAQFAQVAHCARRKAKIDVQQPAARFAAALHRFAAAPRKCCQAVGVIRIETLKADQQ